MNDQAREKLIRHYSRLYRKALKKKGSGDVEIKADQYEKRLREMLASSEFRRHNVYPTMNVPLIMAMCLELRDFGLSDAEIMAITDVVFAGRRKLFDALIRIIDLLPGSFQIARKRNIRDHAKRVKDHSITYDTFIVSEDSVSYRISKCMYEEMLEAYGIRALCKIFCNTDTRSYEGLRRHVHFIRYSDLADGPYCHDEMRRKEQTK